MLKLVYILLLIFSVTIVKAQNDDADNESVSAPREEVTTTVSISTGDYDKRKYDEERIEALKKQKEFQYNDAPQKLVTSYENYYETESSSSSGSSRSPKEQTEPQKPKKGNSSTRTPPPPDEQKESKLAINWLVLVLLAIAIILLILYFTGFKFDNLRRNNKVVNTSDAASLDEQHIDAIHFETELEKAIRLKNYKLAIRIMYLETLKKMNDNGKIEWKLNKTNGDYVNEVRQQNWHLDFKRITNAFDYVWYGNFSVDESTFKLMVEQINGFKQKI